MTEQLNSSDPVVEVDAESLPPELLEMLGLNKSPELIAKEQVRDAAFDRLRENGEYQSSIWPLLYTGLFKEVCQELESASVSILFYSSVGYTETVSDESLRLAASRTANVAALMSEAFSGAISIEEFVSVAMTYVQQWWEENLWYSARNPAAFEGSDPKEGRDEALDKLGNILTYVQQSTAEIVGSEVTWN